VTDSERFYNSILDLLEDQDEVREVDDLLVWWNRLVIHTYTVTSFNTLYILILSAKSFPTIANHPDLFLRTALWPNSRPKG
jgi:hypothetical protein